MEGYQSALESALQNNKHLWAFFFPLLSVRPDFTEMTVLGAAIAAGLAANVWKDTSQLPRATTKIYKPQIQPDCMYMYL